MDRHDPEPSEQTGVPVVRHVDSGADRSPTWRRPAAHTGINVQAAVAGDADHRLADQQAVGDQQPRREE